MEIWKEVAECPAYEVSNLGRIRRKKPYRSTMVGRVLTPCRHRDGHLLARLSSGGVSKARYVHRVVADAFLAPPPDPGMIVRHLNGNPADNRAENLAWGTHKDNFNDRLIHGTGHDGERNPNAKLTDDDVRIIRARHVFGDSKADLSRLFGVSDVQVGKIVRGLVRRDAGGYL